MTSSAERITVVKSPEGEKPNQLPILSSIHEGEQMDDPELDFGGNEEEDHIGVDIDDPAASGRCSSTLPPHIHDRNNSGKNNLSANLTAALNAVNNRQNSIKITHSSMNGGNWGNRQALDTQKPATEVFI